MQAKPILNRGEFEKLVDPRLGGAYDLAQLKRFCLAASLCIRESSLWRPTMTEVPNSILEYIHTNLLWNQPFQIIIYTFAGLSFLYHSLKRFLIIIKCIIQF